MKIITEYQKIDRTQWSVLVSDSAVSTWFQSVEAYNFYASLPKSLEPFVLAVEDKECLDGIVVGYVTKEKNILRQFFTRRAIIIGGPVLADKITNNELSLLLQSLKNYLRGKAIYIETRNFNDYSKWRNVFESCGFSYEPHLDVQVDCSDWNKLESNIGKHRKKYIRLSLRDGASIVQSPSIDQVREFYFILDELYRTKVKTPLYPWIFFENLFRLKSSKFFLVEYNGRIVGGSACVLIEGKGLYEWYACGKDGIYKNIHPSSVVKYAGLRYACDNRLVLFDMMGAGKPNEKYGVRDFKLEFGGVIVEYGRYKYIDNQLLYHIGKIGLNFLKFFT